MKILSMPAASGANVNMIYDNGNANPLYLPFHQYHYSGTAPTVTYGASSIDVTFGAVGHEFFFTLQKIDLTDASAIVLEYDNDNTLPTAGMVTLGISSVWDTTAFDASAVSPANSAAHAMAPLSMDVSAKTGEYYVALMIVRNATNNATGKILSLKIV